MRVDRLCLHVSSFVVTISTAKDALNQIVPPTKVDCLLRTSEQTKSGLEIFSLRTSQTNNDTRKSSFTTSIEIALDKTQDSSVDFCKEFVIHTESREGREGEGVQPPRHRAAAQTHVVRQLLVSSPQQTSLENCLKRVPCLFNPINTQMVFSEYQLLKVKLWLFYVSQESAAWQKLREIGTLPRAIFSKMSQVTPQCEVG